FSRGTALRFGSSGKLMIWGSLLAAAAACEEHTMVSTKLVDGRTTPAWNGWSLSLVEVHQNRLAPVAGVDWLWRGLQRVDTIPHIRSLGTLAVVGDTMVIGVGGYSATAFSYNVRTKELSRTPQPEWLN